MNRNGLSIWPVKISVDDLTCHTRTGHFEALGHGMAPADGPEIVAKLNFGIASFKFDGDPRRQVRQSPAAAQLASRDLVTQRVSVE